MGLGFLFSSSCLQGGQPGFAWKCFFQTSEGEKLGVHLAFPRSAIGVWATFSSTRHLNRNGAKGTKEQWVPQKRREKKNETGIVVLVALIVPPSLLRCYFNAVIFPRKERLATSRGFSGL